MLRLSNAIPAVCLALVLGFIVPATADAATDDVLPRPKPSVLDKLPAKQLFGAASDPADMAPKAIGSYAKGCLAGATELEADGPAWQAVRLSRNRNWGHPAMVDLIKRLAREARAQDGWPGLLVGDLSQPRGGPMPYGHASHQIGLDADVWLTPMPERTLSVQEREKFEPVEMVTERREAIDTKVWTEAHARLIKRAATYGEVERIFVHPPIKKQLCKWATGDRSWLRKVRAYWGHTYHFHIRIKCPPGSKNCEPQGAPRPADGTGCGDELAYWMNATRWRPPDPNAKAPPPKPPVMLSALPDQCRAVIAE